MTTWSVLGETAVTLTVIMDPIGLGPIFVAMTGRLEPAARRQAAMRASGRPAR